MIERAAFFCSAPWPRSRASSRSKTRLIDDLPLLFDAAATSDAPRPSWLEWLSGWVDVELGESGATSNGARSWPKRSPCTAERGTLEEPAPSRHALHWRVPFIQELGTLGVWSLGTTALGFDTALAAAEPQGAVVGSTAVVNRSHLVRDEAYGAPALGTMRIGSSSRSTAARCATPTGCPAFGR